MDQPYLIELANSKTIESSCAYPGCLLELSGHVFSINLIHITLGSFDIVIGMDWLSSVRAEVVCFDKVFRIPLPSGEILSVVGERSVVPMSIISCVKAQNYLRKGYSAILALVSPVPSEDKKPEGIPVVCDFPEVFPEELPGLPPHLQIKFEIDLEPGAAPITKAPYRLASPEMHEIYNQLQELLEKGFIRPSSSP